MLLVQKYGGTSVGNTDRIQIIADRIIQSRREGHEVVVVLSAMAGETDRLLQLAHKIAPEPDCREYDMLLSTGEQASVALMAMALQEKGCPACSMTGVQAGITTDGIHSKARITQIDIDAIQKSVAAGRVPIITGFQGNTPRGEITTLGRGGSDITAVALASALAADECQIFTDVDGVYTSDPRVVPDARRLDQIHFDAMCEMTNLGAKVLHPRALEFVSTHPMPLRILSSFSSGPGTLVTSERASSDALISGIAFNRAQVVLSLLGISDQEAVRESIEKVFHSANVDLDMLVHQSREESGQFDFSFAVGRSDYKHAYRLLDKIAKKSQAGGLHADNKVAKLSLVGMGFLSRREIADSVKEVLKKETCPIQLMLATDNRISVVIAEKALESVVKMLHQRFKLYENVGGEVIPGNNEEY